MDRETETALRLELGRTKQELAIAVKLYARARKITIEEAEENIRDARLNHNEAS